MQHLTMTILEVLYTKKKKKKVQCWAAAHLFLRRIKQNQVTIFSKDSSTYSFTGCNHLITQLQFLHKLWLSKNSFRINHDVTYSFYILRFRRLPDIHSLLPGKATRISASFMTLKWSISRGNNLLNCDSSNFSHTWAKKQLTMTLKTTAPGYLS